MTMDAPENVLVVDPEFKADVCALSVWMVHNKMTYLQKVMRIRWRQLKRSNTEIYRRPGGKAWNDIAEFMNLYSMSNYLNMC